MWISPVDRGLLVVNHEHTNEHPMFPGIVTIKDGEIAVADATRDRVSIEMDLLDEGTLYVARFGKDGSGPWLPGTVSTARPTC